MFVEPGSEIALMGGDAGMRRRIRVTLTLPLNRSPPWRRSFGWPVSKTSVGIPIPGSSTIIKLLPQQRIAVAVLANRTDINDLTQKFANELFHVVLPDYQPVALNPIAR